MFLHQQKLKIHTSQQKNAMKTIKAFIKSPDK